MPKAPINGIELYYESHGAGPGVVVRPRARWQPSELVAAGGAVRRRIPLHHL